MLPRSKRLSRPLFEEVSRGRVFHSRALSLRTRVTSTPSCFGFVVSKKVAPKAVDRNTLKRRASSIVRDLIKNHPLPFSAIIYFKKDAPHLSFTELKEEITTLISSVIAK